MNWRVLWFEILTCKAFRMDFSFSLVCCAITFFTITSQWATWSDINRKCMILTWNEMVSVSLPMYYVLFKQNLSILSSNFNVNKWTKSKSSMLYKQLASSGGSQRPPDDNCATLNAHEPWSKYKFHTLFHLLSFLFLKTETVSPLKPYSYSTTFYLTWQLLLCNYAHSAYTFGNFICKYIIIVLLKPICCSVCMYSLNYRYCRFSKHSINLSIYNI